MSSILYILYNADASVMGKLSYGYKKLTASSKDAPICAACDLTHGGLHLDETSAWKEVKATINKEGGFEIKQLHRDELANDVKRYVESNHLDFPVVLLGNKSGDLKVVLNNSELGSCNGNPQLFVTKLRGEGALPPAGSA